MKKISLIIFSLIASLLLSSCTVKVKLILQKDGAVDIDFNGGAGAAFSKMVISAAGGESSADSYNNSVNIEEIITELKLNGFTDVSGKSENISDVKIKMKDKAQKTYLFTSGILRVEKNHLIFNTDRKTLKSFYDSANEQIQMLLDLFLAPVFNDEEMSEDEYVEMLGTFYGAAAAREVKDSRIDFTIINADGTQKAVTYKMSEIMCTK